MNSYGMSPQQNHLEKFVNATTNMQNALKELISLVEKGWEYPDAHTKVALGFKVNGEKLTEFYDWFHAPLPYSRSLYRIMAKESVVAFITASSEA